MAHQRQAGVSTSYRRSQGPGCYTTTNNDRTHTSAGDATLAGPRLPSAVTPNLRVVALETFCPHIAGIGRRTRLDRSSPRLGAACSVLLTLLAPCAMNKLLPLSGMTRCLRS
jgi:hypothetical protein